MFSLSITTSIYKWIWRNKKQSLNNLQLIDPLKSNSGAVFSHFKSHSSHSLSSPILCPVATFCSGSCLCDRWHSTNISASDLSLHWWAPSVTHHKKSICHPFSNGHMFLRLYILQLSSHIQHLTQWHKREVNLWTGCPTKTHPPRSHDWSWWYSGWWGSQSWWKSERFSLSNAYTPSKTVPPFGKKCKL